MTTTNVISTPEITGNVGSCTTTMASAISNRISFWKEERTTLATNSCDGSVREFKSVEFTGASLTAVVVGLVLILFIGTMMFSDSY